MTYQTFSFNIEDQQLLLILARVDAIVIANAVQMMCELEMIDAASDQCAMKMWSRHWWSLKWRPSAELAAQLIVIEPLEQCD